jgi:hypothetical protein
MQTCRNRNCRRRNSSRCMPRFILALDLQHRLGHFLHEQRDAVGALNDVLSDTLWQRVLSRSTVRPTESSGTPCWLR